MNSKAVWLITGGGEGIGRDFVRILCEVDGKVYFCARNREHAKMPKTLTGRMLQLAVLAAITVLFVPVPLVDNACLAAMPLIATQPKIATHDGQCR